MLNFKTGMTWHMGTLRPTEVHLPNKANQQSRDTGLKATSSVSYFYTHRRHYGLWLNEEVKKLVSFLLP